MGGLGSEFPDMNDSRFEEEEPSQFIKLAESNRMAKSGRTKQKVDLNTDLGKAKDWKKKKIQIVIDNEDEETAGDEPPSSN